MWTALHWVKHSQPNNPSIDMEHIFDQQRPLPGGIVEGGGGKAHMYGNRRLELRGVEFVCGPFNELFWDLWTLFSEYLMRRWKADGNKNPGPGEYPRP